MATIWVYAEIHDGKLDPASLELVTKARQIGDVEAVVLGSGATEAATKLGEYGAEIVYASDDQVYDDYIAQPHVHALAELIGDNAPDMLLFAMNYDSRDIAGRLSARLGSTLMSNVLDIESVDKAKTAIIGGSVIVDVALEGAPKILLARPKSFVAEATGGEATVVPVEAEIPEAGAESYRLEAHYANGDTFTFDDPYRFWPTVGELDLHDNALIIDYDLTRNAYVVEPADALLTGEPIDEQGPVNSLTLANRAKLPLFLLSGEVVIGGKQDRIIGKNTVVAPRTTETVPVFCVEHGRWSGRKAANDRSRGQKFRAHCHGEYPHLTQRTPVSSDVERTSMAIRRMN